MREIIVYSLLAVWIIGNLAMLITFTSPKPLPEHFFEVWAAIGLVPLLAIAVCPYLFPKDD